MRVKVLGKSLFKKVRATLKIYWNTFQNAYTEGHYFLIILWNSVIFVILFHKTVVRNSLDNNLLSVNNKKRNLHFPLVHLLWSTMAQKCHISCSNNFFFFLVSSFKFLVSFDDFWFSPKILFWFRHKIWILVST